MNVVIFIDKYGSAIHNLAIPVEKNLSHLDIKILPVHPKRPDWETMVEAQKLMQWADVIDVHYWKTGEKLKETFPTEWAKKPKILFHMNPYDIDKSDWSDYKAVVVGNEYIQYQLTGSHLIPYGIDLDFYTFNNDYTEENTVMMSVARIESKKGVLEVARVCEELGNKLLLIGRVSEPEYAREIMQNKCVEFLENASNEELRDAYYKAAIHVCNSVDNFESGTLPILESMACGVPVLTRSVGHVPDLDNGRNMIIRKGPKDDETELKSELKLLMENRPLRLKLREEGWETVKNRNSRLMAREINKLYYRVGGEPDKRWVSVIVPTFDHPEALLKCLAALCVSDYPNVEIIVVDSGNLPTEPLVRQFKKQTKYPIRYIRFENKGEYTLPKARNLGTMKSLGEVLVFCDDRLAVEKDAITTLEANAKHKAWIWGSKDGVTKAFVENFSCVLREELIRCGGFNERIDTYGGQTQEIRTRFEMNQFMFEVIPAAKAKSTQKSSKAKRRSQIILAKERIRELYA